MTGNTIHAKKRIFSNALAAILMAPVWFVQPAAAQLAAAPVSAPVTDRLKELREGEEQVREAREPKKSNLLMVSLGAAAWNRANVGDQKGAIVLADELARGYEKKNSTSSKVFADDLAMLEDAAPVDAIQAIAQEAKNRQIVILNEAHHVPMHRAFAMRLARALRTLGFQYLACETFEANDPAPLAKGYVTKRTGFYSYEPTYTKFLLDAQAAGWKFVSYEPLLEGLLKGKPAVQTAPYRETGMAQNIIDRILKADPKGKIFIYAGYGHAEKYPASVRANDGTKLAAQLARMARIVPLTIDQTTLFQHYASAQQFQRYQAVLKQLPPALATPVVLKSSAGKFLKLATNPRAYDMQVVYPDYAGKSSAGRDLWLSSIGDFKPMPIPAELVSANRQSLVYAYRYNDPPEALPLDVVLVNPQQPTPMLMLPSGGKYRFAVEN